jgi:hypothetical protein
MRLPPTHEQTSGFVYLLSNPSMPNIVKIGSTERTIKERISELSSVTSLPTPFVVEYYLLVEDPIYFEKNIHEELKDYRVNEKREFFQISVEEAVKKFHKLRSDSLALEMKEWGEEAVDDFYSEVVWHLPKHRVAETIDEIQKKLHQFPEAVVVSMLEKLFKEKPEIWRELK